MTSTYHSHVLHFPNAKPFDRPEYRWASFVGEFVAPLVKLNLHQNYWFSYYTKFARFRILIDDYEKIKKPLEELRDALGLVDKGEEKDNFTLEGDLGSARFLGAERKDIKPEDRALKVIRLLNAGCDLFIDTLIKDGDYWREEICKNPNNPFDSSSRSYIHLLHNLAQSDIEVYNFVQDQSIGTMSEYYFSHAVAECRIQPIYAVKNRIQV